MRTTGYVLMLLGFVMLGIVGFFPPVRSLNLMGSSGPSSAFPPSMNSPVLKRCVLILGPKDGDLIDAAQLLAEAMFAVAIAGVGSALRSMAGSPRRDEHY
jgi:hypothetical protein